MSKGKWKKTRQVEKLLIVLLNARGREVTINEIATTLSGEIEWYRFPTYLWELGKMGAHISKRKDGKKLVGVTLTNVDEMVTYAQQRGLIEPPPVVLSPSDLLTA